MFLNHKSGAHKAAARQTGRSTLFYDVNVQVVKAQCKAGPVEYSVCHHDRIVVLRQRRLDGKGRCRQDKNDEMQTG
eukprot:373288-Rhodomonas_salina.1